MSYMYAFLKPNKADLRSDTQQDNYDTYVAHVMNSSWSFPFLSSLYKLMLLKFWAAVPVKNCLSNHTSLHHTHFFCLKPPLLSHLPLTTGATTALSLSSLSLSLPLRGTSNVQMKVLLNCLATRYTSHCPCMKLWARVLKQQSEWKVVSTTLLHECPCKPAIPVTWPRTCLTWPNHASLRHLLTVTKYSLSLFHYLRMYSTSQPTSLSAALSTHTGPQQYTTYANSFSLKLYLEFRDNEFMVGGEMPSSLRDGFPAVLGLRVARNAHQPELHLARPFPSPAELVARKRSRAQLRKKGVAPVTCLINQYT